MTDPEKIQKLITLIKELRRMVGFFMKKEIDDILIEIEQEEKDL